MNLFQWLSMWLSSLWRTKHDQITNCSFYKEIVRLQQEQIQLSIDMMGILQEVKDRLDESKSVKNETTTLYKTSQSTKSSDEMKIAAHQSFCSDNCTKVQGYIRPMDTIGTDEMELYTPGGSFHLISSTYKITIPEKPKKKKCSWAVLVSSGPHSGSDVLMTIVAEWLKTVDTQFRGLAVWGFHAHSKMSIEDIELWLGEFHIWLQSLNRGDIVILRTPFFQEDGEAAKQVCENSFVVQSLRSLDDIALLYKLQQTGLTSSVSSQNIEKRTLEYLRQVISHQKRWREDSNLTIHMDEFKHLPTLVQNICHHLINYHLRLEGVCNNPALANKVLNSVAVSYQRLMEEEELLQTIHDHLNDEESSFIAHVRSSFYHWMHSDATIF